LGGERTAIQTEKKKGLGKKKKGLGNEKGGKKKIKFEKMGEFRKSHVGNKRNGQGEQGDRSQGGKKPPTSK